ncbi:MAG: hypothetical protein H3C34_03275 [Caldilineaceae bacterium]|nr:hypothetical protein [Caldilineaceae bacterium]
MKRWRRRGWSPVTLVITVLLLLIAACAPQPAKQVYYYKGQLHVHSNTPTFLGIVNTDTPSCQTPEVVEDWYRALGYTFISITDHNTTTDDPGVGCDQAADPRCIVHINGQEDGWGCAHHLLAIGDRGSGEINPGECCDYLERGLDPTDGRMGTGDKAREVHNCLHDRIEDTKDRADVVFLGIHKLSGASPSPHERTWTTTEVRQFARYVTGMEILNGADTYLEMWDLALTGGAKIWGFGTDDCEDLIDGAEWHVGSENVEKYLDGYSPEDCRYQDGIDLGSCNRSWIVVTSSLGPAKNFFTSVERLNELRQDIVQNMLAGRFYAVVRSPDERPDGFDRKDIGPRLNINFDGDTVSVNTEEGVTPVPRWISFVGACGQELARVEGSTKAAYTLTGNELYVRVEVEQNRFGELYRAYSQPIFPSFDSGVTGTIEMCPGESSAAFLTIDFGCASRTFDIGGQSGRPTEFRVPLPKGSYSYSISSPRYGSESGTVNVGGGFTDLGTFTLQPQGGDCQSIMRD